MCPNRQAEHVALTISIALFQLGGYVPACCCCQTDIDKRKEDDDAPHDIVDAVIINTQCPVINASGKERYHRNYQHPQVHVEGVPRYAPIIYSRH